MSRLTEDGTAESVSQDQILRHEREQKNISFPCSADHEQDWQPYPVDLFSCYTSGALCDDMAITRLVRKFCNDHYSDNWSDNGTI